MSRFLTRLARLEKRTPPPPPPQDRANQQRIDRAFARLDRLVDAALDLMPQEDGDRVMEAAAQWGADGSGPLGGWFTHLAAGTCWLPEVTPEVMRTLLRAWLSPQCDGQGRVCKRCGLEYPCYRLPPWQQWKLLPGKVPLQGPPPWYDLPDFFDACPGCGGSKYAMDWPHLIGPGTYPLAARRLGRPTGRGRLPTRVIGGDTIVQAVGVEFQERADLAERLTPPAELGTGTSF